MSHKHEVLLRAIYHDSPSGNLHWRDVESLLNHIGAKIDNLPCARLHVTINGQETVLHRPHHNNVLDRQGIKYLREYLARAGVTVSALEKG